MISDILLDLCSCNRTFAIYAHTPALYNLLILVNVISFFNFVIIIFNTFIKHILKYAKALETSVCSVKLSMIQLKNIY